MTHLKKKDRLLAVEEVILLQDNVRTHKAKNTLKTIADLGWEIFPHAVISRLGLF